MLPKKEDRCFEYRKGVDPFQEVVPRDWAWDKGCLNGEGSGLRTHGHDHEDGWAASGGPGL